jgi:cytochrome c-type biogenesis protein CcmH/NrfG
MPRRVPADAIHTTAVDHKIARVPRSENHRAEEDTPGTGPVVSFYGNADPLSLAIANIRGTTPDTVALYIRQLDRNPRDVGTLTALGKAYLRLQRPRDAIPVLRQAVKLDPLHTDARAHLGVAFGITGKYDESLAELRRAVADNPDHSLSWINLGATLAAAGQTAEAAEAYREAIRLQPDSSEAKFRLAQVTAR